MREGSNSHLDREAAVPGACVGDLYLMYMFACGCVLCVLMLLQRLPMYVTRLCLMYVACYVLTYLSLRVRVTLSANSNV